MKYALILLLLAASVAIATDTADELLGQVRSEIKTEAKATKNENKAGSQLFLQWQKMLSSLSPDSTGAYRNSDLIRVIQEIETETFSEKLETLCHALLKQLRADQEKQEAALIAKMQLGLAEALRAGLAAKSGRDLDAPITAAHGLIQTDQPEIFTNPRLRNLASQGQQLWQFLRQFQDYFSVAENGVPGFQTDNGGQRLQNLLSSVPDFSEFVPRSEILTGLVELQKANKGTAENQQTGTGVEEQARKIIAETRTLADMAGALQKLENLSPTGSNAPYGYRVDNIIQSLRNFEKLYIEASKGGTVVSNLTAIGLDTDLGRDEILAPLHNQLLSYMLPRILKIEDSNIPRPEETIPIYLNRIADTAREKSDWPLLSRIIETTRILDIEPTANSYDRTALDSFLAGLNQERAQQYALAVNSFQAALRTGSQIIRPELIGDHLEKISKDHPKEFEDGMRVFLTPPGLRAGFPQGYPFPLNAPITPVPTTPPPKAETAPASKPPADPEATKAK